MKKINLIMMYKLAVAELSIGVREDIMDIWIYDDEFNYGTGQHNACPRFVKALIREREEYARQQEEFYTCSDDTDDLPF